MISEVNTKKGESILSTHSLEIIDLNGDQVFHFPELYRSEKEAFLNETAVPENRNLAPVAVSHHGDSRRLDVDEIISPSGVFPCGTSNTHNDITQCHFYSFEIQANRRYAIEVVCDGNQCNLDPDMWIYLGQCDSSSLDGCTYLYYSDDPVDRCGPYGDPYMEFVPTATAIYKLCVGNFLSDTTCPSCGYRYSCGPNAICKNVYVDTGHK